MHSDLANDHKNVVDNRQIGIIDIFDKIFQVDNEFVQLECIVR